MIDIRELAGQTIGPFELRELLGHGSMTAVYRAYQHAKRREVTVKVMSEDLTGATGYLERFSAAAHAASALDHPHIVPFYDYGTQTDLSYVASRHLTGGTLEERIHHAASQNRPRASLSEIAEFLTQIASALDYAHLRAIYHDGIRPENILFDNRGAAYAADFGVARLLRQMSPAQDGLVYLAPERWRNNDATAAVDQYALAMIVYQLIAGRLPFAGVTGQQLIVEHLNEPPLALAVARPDLPEAVSLVIERALAKDPTARFRSSSNFALAFKSAIEGAGGEPTGFFVFKLPKRERQPVPAAARPARMEAAPTPAKPPVEPVIAAAPPPAPIEQPTIHKPRVRIQPDPTRPTRGKPPFPPEPPESLLLKVLPKPVSPAKRESAAPRRRWIPGIAAAAVLMLILIAALIVSGDVAPDFGYLPIPTDSSVSTRVPALEILPTDSPTLAPASAIPDGEGCVLTPSRDTAELYAEPVTIHTITTLAVIPEGGELFTTESRRGRDGFIWYRVTHDGVDGWVHSSAVRIISGSCP